MQLNELGLKPRRSMYSRVGILSEKTSPYPQRTKSDNRSVVLPSLYDDVRPVTPLVERVKRAVKEAEEFVIEAKKKASLDSKPELSCSFTTVSREHLDSLRRSESPTPTQYNPKFQFLMKSSPKVKIAKARSFLLKPLPETRSKSVENKSSSPSVASIETELRFRGIGFEKQLPRRSLINKFDGADFFYSPTEGIVKPKRTHDFNHYSRRKELFELNKPMPDYDPKYSFVSRPRIPTYVKEAFYEL